MAVYNQEDFDQDIRMFAFAWLKTQNQLHPEFLPIDILRQGFDFRGQRVPLLGPQGIFKPKIMNYPLSISTTSKGVYNDAHDEYNRLLYRYRGTDPNHHENVGLRKLMESRTPLIYLESAIPSRYHAYFPVFIVADSPNNLTFTVDLSGAQSENLFDDLPKAVDSSDLENSYRNALIKQRMHQRVFRDVVLRAYHDQCALCRLQHRELLDAAHIISDSEGGKPIVQNGLSMCKIHHAAFDQNIIGINPDYVIEVRQDILEETDGPMLKHGLQEMNNQKIYLPGSVKKRPSQELLEIKYSKFKDAG